MNPMVNLLLGQLEEKDQSVKEAHRIKQQTGDSSEGVGITPEVPDESIGKFTTLSEGVGIVPEVPNEVKGSKITWLSIDDDEKANEDDDEYDDDRSIDIEETNDERSESENDDQEMTDAEEDYAKNRADSCHYVTKGEADVSTSSSSRSMSLNYGNQFLNVSSDTSLVGIIKDHAYTEINSLLDTITTPTPTPLTTPLPTPPIHDPLLVVIQRLDDLESKFEAWTKVDHSEAIEASVQANVINEVKNQLPKVVKDLVESRMESTV
ncbi:hypothetical protein Tco_0407230 [Tanacetum coccineum]